MAHSTTTDPDEILREAKRILLVDWSSQAVPRALLRAGFTVFGHGPRGYSVAELAHERPESGAGLSVFGPEGDAADGWLLFRTLEGEPPSVDIVNTFRPLSEVPGIIANLALPLGARTLWLQPPGSSDELRELAEAQGLQFIEGTDISQTAAGIGSR